MRGAVENQPPRIGREDLRFHVDVGRGDRFIRQLDDLQVVRLGRGNEVRSDFQLSKPPGSGFAGFKDLQDYFSRGDC